MGATIGARPEISASRDSITPSGRPLNRSRAIAMATTAPPAAPTPWSRRMAVRNSMVGDTATRIDDTTCRIEHAISGIRRPRRSLRGPTSSCPVAKPRVVADSVSWTCASEIAQSDLSAGKAGR